MTQCKGPTRGPFYINQGNNMPAKRTVTTILNDMDKIEKSDRLNEQAKRNVMAALQRELDLATGQQSLGDMTPQPPAPPAPASTGGTPQPPKKPS